jgi:hypothetical protein
MFVSLDKVAAKSKYSIEKRFETFKSEGIKKTCYNIGDKLWLVLAHSENPHGFSSGLGFVC